MGMAPGTFLHNLFFPSQPSIHRISFAFTFSNLRSPNVNLSTNKTKQIYQNMETKKIYNYFYNLLLCLLILTNDLVWGGNTIGNGVVVGNKNQQRDLRDDSSLFMNEFMKDLELKYGRHQTVFIQSVREISLAIQDLLDDPVDGKFYQRVFKVLVEPERIISFRVPWEDDDGNIQINRGWRVEYSSALGPYKGGLRFHPSVDEGILKFLGLEQTLKNALTGLPLGGGKGGSDFDPKGKSENEIKRFCQSFMTELYRYLHPATDVPAGDIGVGGREIGYMYGMYKRIANRHGEGILTGKSILFGGSHFRPEATGYGLVYITEIAVKQKLGISSLKNARCLVSGSGNVAQFACQKLLQLGAIILSVSDSNGCLVFPEGMTSDDLQLIQDCKNIHRARLSSLATKVSGTYVDGLSVWELNISCNIALPCATQNEIDQKAVQSLIDLGAVAICEGANLPITLEGQEVLRSSSSDIIYIPSKAANAGGVGVSGLEMSQNAQKLTWSAETVDKKLKQMMAEIYDQCCCDNTLEQGANKAGFIKVANAMRELGWV